mmetsp:Transcript_30498/g.89033  ORF Transcript_30498/g.89033 Transcript_30498/m.89033 type:complete len:221 (-) Transcript_30498:337-999(-)
MRSQPPSASTSDLMSLPITIFHPSCTSAAEPFAPTVSSSSSRTPACSRNHSALSPGGNPRAAPRRRRYSARAFISSTIIIGRWSYGSPCSRRACSYSLGSRCNVGLLPSGTTYGVTIAVSISSEASSAISSEVGRTPRSDAFVHHAKQIVALMTRRFRSRSVMKTAAFEATLRVELTICPQSLRASHQRSYACDVRKASSSDSRPSSVSCAWAGMRHQEV